MRSDFPDEARDLSRRLDRALPPYTHTISGMDDDPLVDAARQLAQASRPILSTTAQQRIEALLRARMLEMQQPSVYVRRNQGKHPLVWAWRALLTLVVIAVLLGAGAVQVSASSLPGDTLYPVKRAFESARLTLVSTASEPHLRLELAERRVDEFEALLAHDRVYPRVLDEANDHLDRALALAARGYGSRDEVNQQTQRLTRRQARLIEQAVPLASAEETQHLQILVDRVEVLQDHVTIPNPTAVPVLPASTITPPPTATLLPSETPHPTATPLPATITPPPTNTPRFTPTPRPTTAAAPILPNESTPANASGASSDSPTRTPPGHGPTPGLGNNPPGQGGDNPGIGNGGNPPGQENKPPKK